MSRMRHSIHKPKAKSPLGTFAVQIPCGSVERWHHTMKNPVLLESYDLPRDLEQKTKAFVAPYNNQRNHESLNNVTPADVYFGRNKAILREQQKIKTQTIRQRRLQHQKQAA